MGSSIVLRCDDCLKHLRLPLRHDSDSATFPAFSYYVRNRFDWLFVYDHLDDDMDFSDAEQVCYCWNCCLKHFGKSPSDMLSIFIAKFGFNY